jgi:hypothetical protein
MRYHLLLLICLSIILLPACRRGSAAPGPAAVAEPAVHWSAVAPGDIVYEGNSGGIPDSVRQVIRDADAYRQVWQEATARQASAPAAPSVDFAREMLLVVAAGRMTPEDRIRVDSVAVRGERSAEGRTEQVMAAIVRTYQGCRRANVAAYPIEIVRVRRFDGPVRWIERRERAQDC